MSSNGEESKLQKNECHVLKHLVANARASDSSMAEKMGISTQAVGKIRRKLEEQRVILGYNVQLNPHYIGLEIFSYVLLSVPSELLTDAAFRRSLVKDPYLSTCVRMLHGDADLLCVFSFPNLEKGQTYLLNFLKKHPGVKIMHQQDLTWHLIWKVNQNDVVANFLKYQ
jgi:Lrp/AsnC family leucine-responsive transcriptional regulator